MDDKKALIFGVSGQDGAYLARFLLERGYLVHGTSRDAEISSFSEIRTVLGNSDKARRAFGWVARMIMRDVASRMTLGELARLRGESVPC